jgi:hypothetical protein
MGHIMSAICDGNSATFLMRTFEDALVLVYEFFSCILCSIWFMLSSKSFSAQISQGRKWPQLLASCG